MGEIFFDGWEALFRTLVIGVLAYIALVAFLRVAGKRTLAKMNAFDWVVTVALGSTLATILLNQDVSLAQGALALLLLIGMQFLVTWSSVRVPRIRRIITGDPQLLLHHGAVLSGALRRERVTETEIQAAVRAAGFATPAEVGAVILETDGTFSVLPPQRMTGGSGLEGVAGALAVKRDEL